MSSAIHYMNYSVGISFAIIVKTNRVTQLTPPSYLNGKLCNVKTLVISIKRILLLCSIKYEKTIWATYDKLCAKPSLH